MKRLHIKINRIYTWKESDLSDTQKKFLNFHFHHIYIKHLKRDFFPLENEKILLILTEGFGEIFTQSIELFPPFDYIFIVDPKFDNYNCAITNGKKVFQIPLEPVIFLQIAQGEKLKIDSLFLSNKNDSLFDFLLEMCYPLMKEEFVITNSEKGNQQQKNAFEVFHKIKKTDFMQFDFYMFMCKTNESKSYNINGKKITIIHGSFFSDIDNLLEAVFSTFDDEWSEYLIRLYEDDIYDLNGVYVSADEKVYDLKIMDQLNELINRCEYKIVGFTLNPRIYEQTFEILMSDNQIREIYIYGFLEKGNTD